MADAKLDSHTAARVFTRAVGVAARAPSINNSQPWWWRLAGEVCELRAQRDRQLATADPEGRLLCLSCGTVLHHTRMALAAEGWCFDVERLPERDKPDLLARLRLTGQTAPDATAVRLSHAAPLRYTDRRPLTMQRVDDEATAAVAAAAEAEGARLYLLRRDQVRELGAITRSALEIERANKAWIEEVGYWTGDRCPVSTGISPGTIPESPDQAIVPNLTRGAKPYGLIENVVTDAAYRRRGLGRQVLHAALEKAWQEHCYKVMLLTGSKQEETLRFYEGSGFKRGVKTGFVATPES